MPQPPVTALGTTDARRNQLIAVPGVVAPGSSGHMRLRLISSSARSCSDARHRSNLSESQFATEVLDALVVLHERLAARAEVHSGAMGEQVPGLESGRDAIKEVSDVTVDQKGDALARAPAPDSLRGCVPNRCLPAQFLSSGGGSRSLRTELAGRQHLYCAEGSSRGREDLL